MKIREIARVVESHPDAKKMMGKGFSLSSIFMMLDDIKAAAEMHVLFYNKSAGKIVDFLFRDGEVEIGEIEDRDKEMLLLDVNFVEIEPEEALEIAKRRFDEQETSKPLNYLASLHSKKIGGVTAVVWTISIIYAGMNVLTYDIDAGSGKIINEERTNIISGIISKK
ncbi:MAG: PepSY domain-containing protein [Candidatus Aenigmarchaeota archaeon]|nr:PepSY domain-containing protein [Candidatus Aenigmarchaeota archaeon]